MRPVVTNNHKSLHKKNVDIILIMCYTVITKERREQKMVLFVVQFVGIALVTCIVTMWVSGKIEDAERKEKNRHDASR